MAKYLNAYRKPLGDFELIDLVEQSDVDSIAGQLEVETPLTVHWNQWEYGSSVADLRALYEKGKRAQWNASDELDWDTPVSKDEWLGDPVASQLVTVLRIKGADEATQKAALFDEVNFQLSQLLHGEQAALQICGQLTNVCPTTDEKYYAAQQTADEARHAEVMARHAAFGVLSMRRLLPQVSDEERQELEDWAFGILEALNANQQLHMLRTLGPKYGIDAERWVKKVHQQPEWPLWNSMMYMHTVMPNLKRLGLMGAEREADYRRLGIYSDVRETAS